MTKFKLKSGNSPLFKNMGSSPAKHTEDWSGFTLPEHEEPHKEIGQGMASYLRYEGMSDEQVDGFFKFANTPVNELGIDNVIKMYNSVNETTATENNLDAVRRTQQAPSTAGVLQGQQPEKKSEADNMWDGIINAGSRNRVL